MGVGERPDSAPELAFFEIPKILKPQGLPRDPCTASKLKGAAILADRMRMFMPCTDAFTVAESSMLAFCAALNTPVINVDGLDVGPARAGILLSAGDYGDFVLVVRVALISNGQGVTFRFQGDPREFGDAAAAVDAALSFSEGMGFLFEEILVAGGPQAGRQRALKIWASLVSERAEASEPAPGTVRAPMHAVKTVAPKPVELELTDALAVVENVSMHLGAVDSAEALIAGSQTQTFYAANAAVPVDAAQVPEASVVGSRVLTKFRNGASDEMGTDRASERLARIELTSEKLGGEAPDTSGFLTRLLSSFWVAG